MLILCSHSPHAYVAYIPYPYVDLILMFIPLMPMLILITHAYVDPVLMFTPCLY